MTHKQRGGSESLARNIYAKVVYVLGKSEQITYPMCKEEASWALLAKEADVVFVLVSASKSIVCSMGQYHF